jgi:RHS repeat-associated protein
LQKGLNGTDTTDARTFTFLYDSTTGVKLHDVDEDHHIKRNYCYDQYSRLKLVEEGASAVITAACDPTDGTSSVRNTYTDYYDSTFIIKSSASLNTYNDKALVETTSYDPLGRVSLTQDAAGNLIQTRYYTPQSGDSNTYGYNFQLVSTPYSITGSPSAWTRTKTDFLGRVVETAHFQGSAPPAPWNTNSNTTSTGSVSSSFNVDTTSNTFCTTTLDEANVSRTSCMDGLGRLIRVVENGIPATTIYLYDTLDDLIGVSQQGQSTCQIGGVSYSRCFSYDSLKRLSSATNPESGTITYTYDDNSNLLTRKDGRNITTSFSYNGIDQVKTKQYSDYMSPSPTPWVGYNYNKGWLTQVTAGSTAYNYTNWDGIGRVTNADQNTNGQDYPFVLHYMPTVGIQSIQYPNSSRVINTIYDGTSGLAAKVTGQIGSNPYYVGDATNSIQYAPHGGIKSMKLGNSLMVTTQFNDRLQPTQIQMGALLSLGYCYRHADCTTTTSPQAQNNGNVLQQTISRTQPTASWTENYTYDPVNRLQTAAETGGWSIGYTYDIAGNRWLTSAPTGLPGPTSEVPQGPGWYLNSNNQITNQISGWFYDCAGNIIGIPSSAGATPACGSALSGAMLRTATYDAENRMTSVTPSSGGTSTYVYDGDGRRVQKTAPGSATTVYVYDPMGNLAQEYGPSSSGGTEYPSVDALGSTRLVTDSGGNATKCYDYLPFGEEISAGTAGRSSSCYGSITYPISSPDVLSEKFTGKERDAESGLDWFDTRYFSGAQGRFTSPDEPFNDQEPADPQSWNLYGYVRNNPLRYVDPSGEDCITATNQTDKSVTVTVASGTCSGNATNQSYVAGTVNVGSLTYNGTSIGFSYASYDPNTTLGAGTVNLGPAPSDALSASAQHVLGQAGTMASDGSVIRGGALWMGQFLAMLDGAGGPREEFEPAEGAAGKSATSAGSTGRTAPENLREQLAMEEVRANPAAGKELKNIKMNDSRWPASQGWVKMERQVNGVSVHYVRNTITGAVDDFKFK